MATHFARGILTQGRLVSSRLSTACHNEARRLPEHRRTRFLASRALLAELLFMLYGTLELPDIIILPEGRPVFADPELPRFSIAYTGNLVGVALTTEGDCGLDMELQRAIRGFHNGPHAHDAYPLSSNEQLWVRNQNDPNEAKAQLITLRQSIRLRCARVSASCAGSPLTMPGCYSCCRARGACVPPRPLSSRRLATQKMCLSGPLPLRPPLSGLKSGSLTASRDGIACRMYPSAPTNPPRA